MKSLFACFLFLTLASQALTAELDGRIILRIAQDDHSAIDTYVFTGSNISYADSKELFAGSPKVANAGGIVKFRSYLWFDVSTLPLNPGPVFVSFRVKKGIHPPDGNQTLAYYTPTKSWEEKIKWNNQPPLVEYEYASQGSSYTNDETACIHIHDPEDFRDVYHEWKTGKNFGFVIATDHNKVPQHKILSSRTINWRHRPILNVCIQMPKLKDPFGGDRFIRNMSLNFGAHWEAFGVPQYDISGKYKLLHTGIDLPKPNGTPVYAVLGGECVYEGSAGQGFGRLACIQYTLPTGEKMTVTYTHVNTNIQVGDSITAGEFIGTVGPLNHLHLQMRWGEYNPDDQLDLAIVGRLPEITSDTKSLSGNLRKDDPAFPAGFMDPAYDVYWEGDTEPPL